MVNTKGSVVGLLRWQWKAVAWSTSAAVLVFLAWRHAPEGLALHALPTLPVSVLGAAIGIFVSFRTNSSYDRWWEGRKLWGRMINSSRHWGTQVMSYVDAPHGQEPTSAQTTLICRHIGYVHALRCLMRLQDPLQDEHVLEYLTPQDIQHITGHSNPTHALLHEQSLTLAEASDAGRLRELRLQSLDGTIAALLDIQGGCERIKKTPMPKGYGYIAELLIRCYALLLPMSLVQDMGWVAIPITVLICLSFTLISEAGRVLEDPFSVFWNGLPLMDISRTIERNLLQCLRIDTQSLPAPMQVDDQGILM